jgi:hypothetical protein
MASDPVGVGYGCHSPPWPVTCRSSCSLIRVDDKERRDRLIAFSIAVGTAAVVSNLMGGAAGHVLFLVFAVIELGCLALYWPWYRQPRSWLRLRTLRLWGWLPRPLRSHEPQAPASVITDCWRFTTDGMRYPQLARIGEDGFGHQAYSRPADSTPPFVRVKALVACSQLAETMAWQDLRGRFLGLLMHASVLELISGLTVIGDGVIWRPRATSRRSWLEADLTRPDSEEIPVASAKLLLPEQGPGLFGTDRKCAELSLHVDLIQSHELLITVREGQESKPVIQQPPYWREQFERALTLPGELEGFLRQDLGLTTGNDPQAEFGVHLKTQGPLSEIVSAGTIKALPAPYIVSEYNGYAIADAAGETEQEVAGTIMLDLAERVLHLDGSPDEMSGLTPSDRAAYNDISSRT